MNAYLLINVFVIAMPLVLSFDRRVVFYRQWRAVFPSILLVGSLYIVEDIIATSRGTWSFAEKYAGTFRLLGLPPGEWLFFITVPYACLFIYACVRAYSREKVFIFPRWILLLTSGAALATALVFRDQAYTKIVMLVFALTCILLALVRPDLPGSRQFRRALMLSYAAFVVVNGVLTSVPVVSYNPQAIWGIRVITIPLEDFFYNFCLLTLNFLIFRLILDRGRSSSPLPGEFAGPRGVGSVDSAVAPYDFFRRRQERRESDDV